LPSRRAALNAVTLVVTIVLFVPLAELGLRLALPAPTIYRPLPPNLTQTFEVRSARGVQGPALYKVNSMGARSREWAAERGTEYRVLCMGGSTTESLANDQSRAWTTLLEQRLGRLPDGRTVWVGNIGKSGWSTRHHVLQARHLLDVYDPDCVVLLTGVNDLASRLKRGPDADPSVEPDLGDLDLLRQSFAIAPGRFEAEWPEDPWYKRTRLWLMVRRLKQGATPSPEAQDPQGAYLLRWRQARAGGRRTAELPSLAGDLDRYGRALREVVSLARGRGARVVLMTQPVLWHPGMTEEEKELLWMGGVGDFRRVPGSLYYEPEALARGMEAYNARLRDVCVETGADCVDLAAAVPRTADFFWDDCHFTDEGQALVADTLAPVVRTVLLAKHTAVAAPANEALPHGSAPE